MYRPPHCRKPESHPQLHMLATEGVGSRTPNLYRRLHLHLCWLSRLLMGGSVGGREMREETAAALQHSLHTISFTVQKFLFELQAGAWNSQRCLLLLLDVLMRAPGRCHSSAQVRRLRRLVRRSGCQELSVCEGAPRATLPWRCPKWWGFER